MSGDPRLRMITEAELLAIPISKLAVQAKLFSSNCESSELAVIQELDGVLRLAEAKRVVEAKGLYVNNQRVEGYLDKLTKEDLLDGRFVVVRCGSQKQLVFVTS